MKTSISASVYNSLREAGSKNVLLAVSGGADSTAMLRLAAECRDELGINLTAAHLNHMVRGNAAKADADWLSVLCESLKIPFIVEEFDVPAYVTENNVGFEEAARNIRYAFLDRVAISRKCEAVAVAHSANDVAETVLHNLLRGTGISGLRGIPKERTLTNGTRIIRPLLSVSRSEIIEYLESLGQDFRIDATNVDTDITRNRIRCDLLPKLRSDYNRHVDSALVRLAKQAEDMQNAMMFVARNLAFDVRGDASDADWSIRWQELQSHPVHLLREMFVAIWIELGWPRQKMTFEHWNRLATMIKTGGKIQFPGFIDAWRTGGLLRLRKRRQP